MLGFNNCTNGVLGSPRGLVLGRDTGGLFWSSMDVVKKKGPVAFSLSTLRNMICAVLGCCGTEQDFYRRLGLGTVRNRLVSVGF